jgi:hypothetical protein
VILFFSGSTRQSLTLQGTITYNRNDWFFHFLLPVWPMNSCLDRWRSDLSVSLSWDGSDREVERMDKAAQWLQKNTYHYTRFADLDDLMRRKERQGLSISLCIPTLNEAGTIASLVTRLRTTLRDHCPLLDEIAVIDSGSEDRTLELAAEAGAAVHRAADILPGLGRY